MQFIWFVIGLFTVGLFFLIHLLLDGFVDGLYWLFTRWRRSKNWFVDFQLAQAAKAAVDVPEFSIEDLLGIGHIPWLQVYALSFVVTMSVYVFTEQKMIFLIGLLPMALRLWLTNYRKRQLDRDVWAYLMDLRIRLPMGGSLLRAMKALAEDGSTRMAQLTASYLKSGFQGDGLALLERLASDTKIPHLDHLVAWTHAAQEGVMKVDQPFDTALARLRDEMDTAQREHLQRIPTRLTIFVLPGLLGPAIVILLYPMVARMLASLGSTSFGGGF